MERNLQAAVEADDAARVARGLLRTAKLAPSADWNTGDQGWAHRRGRRRRRDYRRPRDRTPEL